MSSLGDIGSFEMFNLKDMWKKLKKHPEQLLTGVDPASNKLWSGVTGHDFGEPLVDQLGGAYGGKVISMGPGGHEGGVYGRAKAAGIDTTAGGGVQDVAHVIAMMYGAQGLGGIGNGNPSGQAPGQDWQQYMRQMPKQQGQKQQDPYDELKKRRAAEEDPYAQMLAALMQQQASTNALGYNVYG